MDNSIDKLAANYLLRDVVANTVHATTITPGDIIVVTLDLTDKIGVVTHVSDDHRIFLKTASGIEVIEPVNQGFIHMIQKAAHAIEVLRLRNHLDYERDLKDMTKETHQNSGRPEYGPEIDKDTKIPRSKICLNLKKKVSK